MTPRRRGLAPLLAAAAVLAPTPAAAVAPPPALAGVERVERTLLPPLPGPVSVRVHALESMVELEAPRAVAPLGRALRLSRMALCPDAAETSTGVTLRCRSRRVVARLARTEGGYALDVSETRGLPWTGEDGAPLVALDALAPPPGRGCAGTTGLQRAECLVRLGDRDAARTLFAAVTGPDADGLPALRLGDLALAQGDVLAAASHWSRTRGQPWEHLATARLCELSWACLAGSNLDALYGTGSSPAWATADLVLRHARTLAFLDRGAEAVATLMGSERGLAGCAAAGSLCRDIAGAALGAPGAEALDALALWLSVPEAARDAAGYQAAVAAAEVAQRAGAPLFAANLLAATVGQVPARTLGDHLLRTAELYLAGGDAVRAGVILDFARARGPGRIAGQRWAAVTRSVHGATPAREGGAR